MAPILGVVALTFHEFGFTVEAVIVAAIVAYIALNT